MKNNLQNSRDISIDLLRTIGILFIFLAHVDAPFVIKQVIKFNVILLVVISGYVYREVKDYKKYIYKRIERLALPTWLFLTFFFLGLFLVEKILKIKVGGLNIDTIISSYTFWWGIGFVWIIRIYLGVAILGPIFLKRKLSFSYLILFYFILEFFIAIILKKYNNENFDRIIEILPYTLIFCYGNLLKKGLIPIKKVTFVLGIFILVFIMQKYNIDMGEFKSPPRLIYIWWGLFVFNILFLLKDKLIELINKKIILKKIIQYIGESTMWFYLIHIGTYYILFFIKKSILIDWRIEYLVLILLSFIILVIKDMLIKKIEKLLKNRNIVLEMLKG